MVQEPAVDLECVFAVYVTTKAPVKVLEDLVKSSADAWPSAQYVKSPYLLSIFRNKAEVSREEDRIKGPSTLSGTEIPIPETQKYDFLDANLFDLAKFTLDKFPGNYSFNNKYMLVVDERSVKDRTCILVEIPKQVELDDNKDVIKIERKFNRRDEYAIDPRGWLDEEAENTGVEEIKMVRVTFEDANIANMLNDGHETIGFLAQHTYQTDGVYTDGASYPGGD